MTKENPNHIPLVSISEKQRHSMTKLIRKLEARVLEKYRLKINRKETNVPDNNL